MATIQGFTKDKVISELATKLTATVTSPQDNQVISYDAATSKWINTELVLPDIPTSSFKDAVKAATTANITLSAPQTIDGIVLVAGDRVLVKNQTAGAENGIYKVQAAAWTRTTDADSITDIANAIVPVDSGTANGGLIFHTTIKITDTLGTTSMSWYRVIDTSYVIPATQGGTGQTSYAIGDLLYAPTATTVSKLADVATGNALISGGVGVAPSYGKIGLTTHVSGTLPLANGGTNGTSAAVNGGVVYSNATAMAITAAGTQDQVLKSNGAAAPTWQTLDLTYMPDAAYKKSVKAATTANITLSAPQTIDGIALVAGDRVLVKNQTAAAENGIYIVQAAAWTRATDADTISEVAGATVNVDSGTQGSQLWSNNLKTTDTLGTTAMVWTRLINTGDVGSVVQGYNATLAAVAGGTYTGDDNITTVGTIGAGTWQGTDVGLAYGGTNATLTAVNGGAVYSTATGLAITAAGTAGQVLRSNGAAAPTWQTDNLDSMSDVVITSPTAGQTLAYNGTNWINGSGGGGGVTASATAPASPVNGSAWFDTNDGTLYVYYTDVNGSQWVEVQADSALGSQLATRMSTAETNITGLTAKDGLIPIVPTSVTVNVGSGSVAANGTITISGASSVTLNGIFSSTYNNYYIVSAFTSASADADIQSQLTGPSTLNAGYIGGRYGMASSGVTNTWYTTQGSATIARMSGSGGCSFQCVITNPGNTSYKRWLTQTMDNDFAMNGGFRNTTSAVAYTGMNLYTTTPTFGGTIKVYGYN